MRFACVHSSWVWFLAGAVPLLPTGAVRGDEAAMAKPAPVVRPAGGSWKYDVEILRSTSQYRVHLLQFRDSLYADPQGRLWLKVDLHFAPRSDLYYLCFSERILRSEDQGLSWHLVDGLWPGPRDTRSVLSDGTIVETGSHCFVNSDRWERYPIAEMDRLELQGYYVNRKQGENGFCSLLYDFWSRRSTDGGQTWTETPIHEKLPFFAYIASRHYQRVLDDRTVIAFFSGRPTADGPRSAYAVRSRDEGKTWELVTVADGKLSHVPEGFHETFPIVWRDGRIMALVRTQLGDVAYLVRSEDGGQTWSKPEKTPIVAKHPVPTLLRDGTIVVTYPRRFAPPFGVRARFTSDMGNTWSEEVLLRDNFEHADGLAHPLTVEMQDGTLFTVLQGDCLTDDKKYDHRILGVRWTRAYRPPIGPQLPTPARQAKFNYERRKQSPWQRAKQLGRGPMFLYPTTEKER